MAKKSGDFLQQFPGDCEGVVSEFAQHPPHMSNETLGDTMWGFSRWFHGATASCC